MTALSTIKPLSVGHVCQYAGTAAPAGWLFCNGQAISRTTYARLFTAIGTTYGVGDGATTFNLPEIRGEFVRGFDPDGTVDFGRTLGSAQEDQLGEHPHGVGTLTTSSGAGAHPHPSATIAAGALVGTPAPAPNHDHVMFRRGAPAGLNSESATPVPAPTPAATMVNTIGGPFPGPAGPLVPFPSTTPITSSTATAPHAHPQVTADTANAPHSHTSPIVTGSAGAAGAGTPAGAEEVRPRNVALVFIIKV